MTHDVFISHSSKDKLTADAICSALEKNGVRCWIAPRDVRPGADYPGEIIRGIEESSLMVLVFSKESNNSSFVYAEVERAFAKGKTIIPYRLSKVEMSDNLELLLAGKHWINAYPNDTVFADLTQAVGRALDRPIAAAPATYPETHLSKAALAHKKFDVYICYRRGGGETMAAMLRDRLSDEGCTVFLDFECLNTRTFDDSLYPVIEQCTDFLVICTAGCMERCKNDDDWIRKEISFAIQKQKNIVPVLLRGFDWPKVLPADIAALPTYAGVELSGYKDLNVMLRKLTERHMLTFPKKARKSLPFFKN